MSLLKEGEDEESMKQEGKGPEEVARELSKDVGVDRETGTEVSVGKGEKAASGNAKEKWHCEGVAWAEISGSVNHHLRKEPKDKEEFQSTLRARRQSPYGKIRQRHPYGCPDGWRRRSRHHPPS